MCVLADGKKVYDWPLPALSVFFVNSNCVVYHAVFRNSSTGCKVVAYDLKGRKAACGGLHLKGLVAVGDYDEYSNKVRLERVNDEVLAVYGDEVFYGRYVEIVDMKTGKTVGHKVCPKKADGKEDKKKEGGAEAKPSADSPLAKTDPPNPCRRTSSQPGRRPGPKSAGCG